MKKLLSLLLLVLMCVSILPAVAFAGTNVAQIGSNKYETLAQALIAATSGDIIEVLSGTWGTEAIGTLTPSQEASIGLKSLTIKPATGAVVKFTSDVELGIDNSSTANANINVSGLSFENASLFIGNYVCVTVENCSFSGTGNKAGAIMIIDSCCKIHKTEGTYPTALVTVKNCIINGTDTEKAGIRIKNSGNVTITGNLVKNSKGNGILLETHSDSLDTTAVKTINIKDNTIIEWNASNADGGGRGIRIAPDLITGSTINIENNIFSKASLGLDEPDFIKITGADNATISHENNYWSGKTLADVSGKSAIYTVDGSSPAISTIGTGEAKIGNKQYATLQDAIDNAIDGDTVCILKDIVLYDQIRGRNHNITIDGNNHKITMSPGIVSAPYQFFNFGTQDTGAGKTFTVKNLNIDGINKSTYMFRVEGCNMILDNVDFTNCSIT